jgi:hypothetical protein
MTSYMMVYKEMKPMTLRHMSELSPSPILVA